MTLPPPPAPALDDEVTVTDADEEVAFMLDCIAIETRIRTALRYQQSGFQQPRFQQPCVERAANQGLGADDETGASSSELVPMESGEFVVGTMRPWGKYFPPSSC